MLFFIDLRRTKFSHMHMALLFLLKIMLTFERKISSRTVSQPDCSHGIIQKEKYYTFFTCNNVYWYWNILIKCQGKLHTVYGNTGLLFHFSFSIFFFFFFFSFYYGNDILVDILFR